VLFLFELFSASVVSFGVLIALFSLCTFSYPLHFIMPTEQPPSDSTDIFSLSDRVLADKLQFVKEVRFSIYVLAPTAHVSILDWLWELG
jgi:hypothetical protein